MTTSTKILVSILVMLLIGFFIWGLVFYLKYNQAVSQKNDFKGKYERIDSTEKVWIGRYDKIQADSIQLQKENVILHETKDHLTESVKSLEKKLKKEITSSKFQKADTSELHKFILEYP